MEMWKSRSESRSQKLIGGNFHRLRHHQESRALKAEHVTAVTPAQTSATISKISLPTEHPHPSLILNSFLYVTDLLLDKLNNSLILKAFCNCAFPDMSEFRIGSLDRRPSIFANRTCSKESQVWSRDRKLWRFCRNS